MKGVRVAAHQSSKRSDSRKLFSMMASPSVATVEEMAPRWITASSLRVSSQRISSPGGTKSANRRPVRLRHLPSLPSVSLTAISVRPASLRLATTFDPMNPAPPVTNNIDAVRPVDGGSARPDRPRSFALMYHAGQHWAHFAAITSLINELLFILLNMAGFVRSHNREFAKEGRRWVW